MLPSTALTVLVLTLVASMVAPLAHAQTGTQEDGCTSSSPCELEVVVDEAGIDFLSITRLSSGDWFTLFVSNLDERTHTVTFAGLAVQVESLGEGQSQPFAAGSPGTYKVRDEPSGHEQTIEVVAGDVTAGDSDDAASTQAKGAPSLPAALLAIALVVAVVGRRR